MKKCTDHQDILRETNARTCARTRTHTHTHTHTEKEIGKEPVRNIERLVDPFSQFLTGENSETMPETPELGYF